MSLHNGIAGAMGAWTAQRGHPGAPTTTGQQPGAQTAAQSLSSRFGSVFQTTFRRNLSTVFERGAAGEFDDPQLALQEQAAMARLAALRDRSSSTPVAGGGPPAPGSGAAPAEGANAAPVASGGPGGAATGAATIHGSHVGRAEQRELLTLRIRQSEARLANISRSLGQEYPKAAALASASTGTWDPARFVPKSREEAEAFAQRMVIDATEAAARLEIVATQLDAARFEAAATGSPAAAALVVQYEADFRRQQAYVDKLAGIVDTASGGAVSSAGADALAGRSMRDAGDLPAAEFAKRLRSSGMAEDDVRRVIGAAELAVEEERTPGGSRRLRSIASEMTAFIVAHFERRRERRREEQRRLEEKRHLEQRIIDKAVESKRAERRIVGQQLDQAARERHAAERESQFRAWLMSLGAASQEQQQQAG